MLRIALIAFALTALTPVASGADDSVVDMTASADTFTFSPDKIVAHVGQLETIDVKSIAGEHGIGSAELGIDTQLIRPNRTTTVSFTPAKAGTYVVHCAYVCGIGHAGMAFSVDVEP